MKRALLPTAFAVLLTLTGGAFAQSISFGDDSGDYTFDGECDDRRFFGPGTAIDIDSENIGRDATDCQRGFEAGNVFLWNEAEAALATSCAAIDFGNNSSDYADDNACDDPRFEGLGTAATLLDEDRGRDAADCARLCTLGALFLRDYQSY
ncbi:MAG: hypothetical protein AAFY97_04875 [Pseudomonadota bacterium]